MGFRVMLYNNKAMPKVQQAQADLGIIRTPELARVTVRKQLVLLLAVG